VTEAHVCEQLAQSHYMKLEWPEVMSLMPYTTTTPLPLSHVRFTGVGIIRKAHYSYHGFLPSFLLSGVALVRLNRPLSKRADSFSASLIQILASTIFAACYELRLAGWISCLGILGTFSLNLNHSALFKTFLINALVCLCFMLNKPSDTFTFIYTGWPTCISA